MGGPPAPGPRRAARGARRAWFAGVGHGAGGSRRRESPSLDMCQAVKETQPVKDVTGSGCSRRAWSMSCARLRCRLCPVPLAESGPALSSLLVQAEDPVGRRWGFRRRRRMYVHPSRDDELSHRARVGPRPGQEPPRRRRARAQAGLRWMAGSLRPACCSGRGYRRGRAALADCAARTRMRAREGRSGSATSLHTSHRPGEKPHPRPKARLALTRARARLRNARRWLSYTHELQTLAELYTPPRSSSTRLNVSHRAGPSR